MRVLLLFLFMQNSFAFEHTDFLQRVKKIHLESIEKVGEAHDMRLRSKIFHQMYLEDKNFLFGLSTAHLTLAIDRFANSGFNLKKYSRVFRNSKLTHDLILWGKILKEINKKMTQLLLFSKDLFLLQQDFNLSEEELLNLIKEENEILNDAIHVRTLLNLWKQLSIETEFNKIEKIAHEFIHWEHFEVIGPRLENAQYKVGKILRYFLKNVSGRFFEKKFLLRYKVRSTISLNCFKKTRFIHTKNFLSSLERKKRAIEFLNELKKINYDPEELCFKDPYYQY